MDIKGRFWIKKTERRLVNDAKKETSIEVLTVTLEGTGSTKMSISGDPNILDWLQSGLDVNVHIKPEDAQSTLVEGEKAQVKAEPENGWDHEIDE